MVTLVYLSIILSILVILFLFKCGVFRDIGELIFGGFAIYMSTLLVSLLTIFIIGITIEKQPVYLNHYKVNNYTYVENGVGSGNLVVYYFNENNQIKHVELSRKTKISEGCSLYVYKLEPVTDFGFYFTDLVGKSIIDFNKIIYTIEC